MQVLHSLLSMELGRVLLIDDADCDIGLPTPVDDHFIYEHGVMMPPGVAAQSSNFLLTTIHIVRQVAPLFKMLHSPSISPKALSMFDGHFAASMEAFPPNCQINNQSSLDPRHLHLICHLQNIKLVLHRHNLSTACAPDVRAAALDACVAASRDTVTLLHRVMQWSSHDHSNGQQTWKGALVASATAMLCTHIWRCTLFLVYRGFYAEAVTCIQFSSAIGEARAVNQACGRYLHGFLVYLLEKLQKGENVDNDEALLAIVSGDEQGSTESSWIWTGSETGTALNNGPHSDYENGVDGNKQPGNESNGDRPQDSSSISLSPEQARDWGGWPNIEWMLQSLVQRRENMAMGGMNNNSHPGSSTNGISGTSTPAASGSGGASRISIPNII